MLQKEVKEKLLCLWESLYEFLMRSKYGKLEEGQVVQCDQEQGELKDEIGSIEAGST